jgi:hypothetical protein
VFTASSLPPAPPAAVRATAERLLALATAAPAVPALKPAIHRARVLMAQTGIGATEHEMARVYSALEDICTAVLHTIARLERSA